MRSMLFIALILVGTIAGCSRPHRQYQFVLDSAEGFKNHNAIIYRGVQVGYVKDVHLVSGEVFATGIITDPQMHLLDGDLFRVAQEGLLGNPAIEIVRGRDTGTELPSGSTVKVLSSQRKLTDILVALQAITDISKLPPEKQKQVLEQIRGIIEAASADNGKDAKANP